MFRWSWSWYILLKLEQIYKNNFRAEQHMQPCAMYLEHENGDRITSEV